MNNLELVIKKLGPVKDTKIEIAPVMIFTGASNLGKSYVNFLTYYVFNVFSSNRLTNFLHTKVPDEMTEIKEFTFHFSIEDICKWMEEDVKLFFQYLLNYPDVPCDVSFKFSTEVTDFEVTVKEKSKIRGISEDLMKMAILKINEHEALSLIRGNDSINYISAPIAKILGKIILDIDIRYAYLLPPGRASLLNESYSRQAETSKTGMYDIFLRDFDRINNLRNVYMQRTGNGRTDKNMGSLINGVLNSTKDGIFLKLEDNTEIPLSATASSIKELSPFLLWMQTRDFNKNSMCIEEPEAHAHPEMQYGIADMIAVCANKGALIQMTTHSDYLLARLNQLIKLYELKDSNPELYEKICKTEKGIKELALDRRMINAYYFSVDNETHNINVEKQDISDGIPFTSFLEAVKKQMDWDNLFEDNLEYGDLQ